MAQNITLMGASYSNVPSVQLPKTGGGTATFDDTTISSNAAAASDITSGKLAYVNGSLITGTNSGGGGSNWTLLGSKEMTISTTSTSNTNQGDITCSGAFTKDDIIWVRVRDKAGKRAGYMYGTDTFFLNANKANSSTSTYSTKATEVIRYSTSSQWACYTGNYGVYGYSISSAGKILIYSRYNSTNTLTINGTYLIEVYKLTLPTGKTIFG